MPRQRWAQGLLIIGILLFISLPILLWRINIPFLSSLFPRKFSIGGNRANQRPQFSAQSELPGYELILSDTNYVDYYASKYGVFRENAIVADPQVYRSDGIVKPTGTVSHVRFTLAPELPAFLMALPGKNGFISKGDYRADGKMLDVRVSLDFDEINRSTSASQYGVEEAFLRTVFSMLYFATGTELGARSHAAALLAIQKDIDDYLKPGIFAWPFRIRKL